MIVAVKTIKRVRFTDDIVIGSNGKELQAGRINE